MLKTLKNATDRMALMRLEIKAEQVLKETRKFKESKNA